MKLPVAVPCIGAAKPVRLLILTVLFLVTAELAYADGFIIPVPPPHVSEIVPDLAVKYHHVQVTINEQLAQTQIDQVFLNESPYELEGTYIFPLPEDAAISEFAMFVDGERLARGADHLRRLDEIFVPHRAGDAIDQSRVPGPPQ